MGEAVGCVTKAVDLALRIKDAVDTVRQNKKDCAHIRRRVERVGHTLSLCEGNAELMESPAVRAAVEALAEVLGEALELVTGCQEETNAVCLYCTARKVSKQLGKVDRGISDRNSEATFAILVYHISKQTGGDGAGPPAMPTDLGWGCRRDSISWGDEDDYGGDGDYRGHGDALFDGCDGDISGGGGDFFMEAMVPCFMKLRKSRLVIGTAMKMVHRNKDECVQIDKLASRIIPILSQLEHTEKKKSTAVRQVLKSLLKTFRHTHKLVAICQRRSVVVLCSPGKLSGELRGVLDKMMLGLDHLIDALL
uniref:Uncharacterized protein n=1 Tax=Avena sativa TaxID=4498 RepID=A0ACD5U097_AVESA